MRHGECTALECQEGTADMQAGTPPPHDWACVLVSHAFGWSVTPHEQGSDKTVAPARTESCTAGWAPHSQSARVALQQDWTLTSTHETSQTTRTEGALACAPSPNNDMPTTHTLRPSRGAQAADTAVNNTAARPSPQMGNQPAQSGGHFLPRAHSPRRVQPPPA